MERTELELIGAEAGILSFTTMTSPENHAGQREASASPTRCRHTSEIGTAPYTT